MAGDLAQSSPMAPSSISTAGAVLQERRSSPGLLLALLGHVAMRRLRDAHTASHLSPRQFHLLGVLHDHGAMSQTELGQTTGTDPSILVTMLNPLEADRLIARERDLKDRRRHLVTLTPAGEQHLNRAAEAQREVEAELFVGLDEEQREQLRRLLIAVQQGLGHEPSCPS
jgi:DNA-binding MarR family transcriptional regulator